LDGIGNVVVVLLKTLKCERDGILVESEGRVTGGEEEEDEEEERAVMG
jgi:hypothetical protein